VVLRGVSQESPAITGEVPEQQLPKTPSARASNYQSGRASDRPVEAFKRRCPGEAQRFSKSGTAVVQGHARQKKAQRTSTATPADITGSHVTMAAQRSLGSAGTSRTSSTRRKRK